MKYKVIIADDESLIVKSLVKIINWEALECEVAGTAQDGNEALELVRIHQPHIVVTDICMPEMSGIELLKALHASPVRPEVLLISGYNEFEYAREGLQYHAFDYILKPIDHEELTTCIRRMVDQLKEKEKSDYELKKHKIYELLILGNSDETFIDEQGAYAAMIVQFRHFTEQNEQMLKHWVSGKEKDGAAFQNFLFRLENSRFLIVCVNVTGDGERLYDYVEESAHKAAEMFENNCTIAIGKWVRGLSRLSFSYQQAKQYIETSAFLKMNIVTEEDIKNEYKSKNTPDAFIKKAELFLRDHFTDNIGIDMVAEQVGLSVSHFSVLFKQKTGVTFLDYLTRLRMNHACLLLETTDLKTYEIANMVGYTDQRYFSQVFKKYVNLTPSQYRKKAEKILSRRSGRIF
ncbi:response regulator [Priestia abyssalis]|uniref:response regulator n=1 Tax=Priestia abyssalis TaxID=1221450 RepID=UPI0009953A23|nr:response regulator [Priestia abyssalis]